MTTVEVRLGLKLDHGADWPEFRKWLDGTYAFLRYTWAEDANSYTVVAKDDGAWRVVGINKDSGADQVDFEATYKVTATLHSPTNPADRIPLVALAGREGSETIHCTVNYCDRRTWWCGSQRVTGETLTETTGTTFQMAHFPVIRMDGGLIFDEDALASEIEHGYVVKVYVAGVLKTARAPFATSGGDYWLDYNTGLVTFAQSQTGLTVTADYSYAMSADYILKPTTGKALDIDYAEIDLSLDVGMTDTVVFAAYGYVQVFAPQLWDGYNPPGPYPLNTLIPLQTTKYKSVRQIKQEGIGVSPIMPALSPSTNRGTGGEWVTIPFRYGALRRLFSSYGMELHIGLETDTPFTGDNATATFYCISRNESDMAH